MRALIIALFIVFSSFNAASAASIDDKMAEIISADLAGDAKLSKTAAKFRSLPLYAETSTARCAELKKGTNPFVGFSAAEGVWQLESCGINVPQNKLTDLYLFGKRLQAAAQ